MSDPKRAAGASATEATPSAGSLPYICGDCGVWNTIKPSDPVRCRTCGHRVLYKPRTKRLAQYEAR